jgi:hypothetical protein
VETDGVRLTTLDFDKNRLHEIVELPKKGTTKYCALWQADRSKIARMAPAEYMGRYMPEWWDYAIADEIHQLAGDTAQGNALGVLVRSSKRFVGLTGTLLSGYADAVRRRRTCVSWERNCWWRSQWKAAADSPMPLFSTSSLAIAVSMSSSPSRLVLAIRWTVVAESRRSCYKQLQVNADANAVRAGENSLD